MWILKACRQLNVSLYISACVSSELKLSVKNISLIFAKVEIFLMVSKKKFFGKSQEEGDHSQPTSLCFQFLVSYRGSLLSEDFCI